MMGFVDNDDVGLPHEVSPPRQALDGTDLHRGLWTSGKICRHDAAFDSGLIHRQQTLPNEFNPMHPKVGAGAFFDGAF